MISTSIYYRVILSFLKPMVGVTLGSKESGLRSLDMMVDLPLASSPINSTLAYAPPILSYSRDSLEFERKFKVFGTFLLL
jgi:hypothetical protein